jgi:hypothetical protein
MNPATSYDAPAIFDGKGDLLEPDALAALGAKLAPEQKLRLDGLIAAATAARDAETELKALEAKQREADDHAAETMNELRRAFPPLSPYALWQLETKGEIKFKSTAPPVPPRKGSADGPERDAPKRPDQL